ncbi:cell division protein FtsL [Vibrio sp.]|uniref:Cell division protein FtsL n=1 Tax=Vibrio viridaestus TaxID=2487322 RepID=A0A3N9TGS6_9VIBR|nr:cell division protein FtsL [Vibrio viridaestus]MDC0609277.1 cell division protein FtsL [Vibrio sp.]RQW62963.1 cell division protein FtsL [Vibrio viridaestus]
MAESTRYPNLAKLIAKDLITVGRIPLVLMILLFASAMGVVFATHQTRQAISTNEQEMMERDRLDNEWRNLLIEETALSDHSRVEDIAKKDLDMKRPDADKEVIISQP